MLLEEVLRRHQGRFSSVVSLRDFPLPWTPLDFSERNQELTNVDLSNTFELCDYVVRLLKRTGGSLGIGGYCEKRSWYQRSSLFDGAGHLTAPRTVHIGVDLWVPAGTKIFPPLSGVVHSFRNNAGFGDYGPTIILQHSLEGLVFYTLFGHLSEVSLIGLYKGQKLETEKALGSVGNEGENGHWPPHLHLQVIHEIGSYEGDFPGVVAEGDLENARRNCPDPTLLLPLSSQAPGESRDP